MILAACLLFLSPLADARDAALARIDKEQQAIESVLQHPDLWRVAHRREQELNERYWTLEPARGGEARLDAATVLSLPGITVAQAGRLLALYAEEEELNDLDRAQRRVFIAKINGRELSHAEDRRARELLRAIDDDTKARKVEWQARLRKHLTERQRNALARIPPRMSPRAREVAYERLLKLQPRMWTRWESGRRMRRNRVRSPFPLAVTIGEHRAMGRRLEELAMLAHRAAADLGKRRLAAWIAEVAPKRRKSPRGKGVSVWLAAPYGVREFEVGPLKGGSDWSNTLYRAGHLALAPGERELPVRVGKLRFTAKVRIQRGTSDVYILALPAGIRAATVTTP
ncbi:MAG: hypothetical protein ACYTGZ_18070 [Planctomycetota bacterium]